MSEVIDTPTIINRALARIGAAPIASIDADDDETRAVMAIWADLVDAAFVLWDWHWPRRIRALEALAAKPFGYATAFRFPADAMGPPLALYASEAARADPLRDYRVEGREVAVDASVLWGRFVCRIDPADWPADFRLAFTVWLASSLCVPLTHDADLAARLAQEALGAPSEQGRGGLIGRAIAGDAAKSGGVAPLNTSDTLTSAHRGGRDWSFF